MQKRIVVFVLVSLMIFALANIASGADRQTLDSRYQVDGNIVTFIATQDDLDVLNSMLIENPDVSRADVLLRICPEMYYRHPESFDLFAESFVSSESLSDDANEYATNRGGFADNLFGSSSITNYGASLKSTCVTYTPGYANKAWYLSVDAGMRRKGTTTFYGWSFADGKNIVSISAYCILDPPKGYYYEGYGLHEYWIDSNGCYYKGPSYTDYAMWY